MVFEMSTVLGLIRMTGSRTANVGWPTFGVKRTVSWERAAAAGVRLSIETIRQVRRMVEAGGRRQETEGREGTKRYGLRTFRTTPACCPLPPASCLLPPFSSLVDMRFPEPHRGRVR